MAEAAAPKKKQAYGPVFLALGIALTAAGIGTRITGLWASGIAFLAVGGAFLAQERRAKS